MTEFAKNSEFWHLGCLSSMSVMKRILEAKVGHYLGLLSIRMPVFRIPGFRIPVRLQLRNDLHLMRKSWHMFMGLMIAFIYLGGIAQEKAVLLLSFFLALDLFIERTRLRSPAVNEKVLKYWAPFMRVHEMNQLSTIPHYLSSILLAVAIFPKPVAVLSILYLACGDPIASLFGILYGCKGPRFKCGKTMIGTSAGVVVCALLTFVFLKTLAIPYPTILTLSVIGGVAGGTTELLPFDIDDNFTIPIVSGFVMWLAFMVAGI